MSNAMFEEEEEEAEVDDVFASLFLLLLFEFPDTRDRVRLR